MSHLRALEKKGVIQRHAHKARAVVFPEDLDRAEIIDIPVFGQIPAGMAAADMVQHADRCISVDVNTLGIPRSAKSFALKVRGESMIGALIGDGELERGVLTLKDLAGHTQEEIPLDGSAQAIADRLASPIPGSAR